MGLVMNFVLQLAGSMSITAVVVTQLETEMVSVQRIFECCDTKAEGTSEKPRSIPSAAWPAEGEIVFDAVSASYDPNGLPVLRDINLVIRSGQKVGIVGRSGAGKSSFVSALLGLVELSSGCVRVDNVDISTVQLDTLRQRITTIPQETTAFSGSVRNNLDPNRIFDTTDLIKAIEDSRFVDGFPNPYEALNFELTDKGYAYHTSNIEITCSS
jgi:ATP-binding cassette, subfamily C (CFTR/MRP), member 1